MGFIFWTLIWNPLYVGSNLTRITTQLLKIDDKMAFLYLTAEQLKQYFTVLQILEILLNNLRNVRFFFVLNLKVIYLHFVSHFQIPHKKKEVIFVVCNLSLIQMKIMALYSCNTRIQKPSAFSPKLWLVKTGGYVIINKIRQEHKN